MKTTCLIFLLNLLYLTAASARPAAHSEPVSGVRHAVVLFAKFRDEAAPDAAPAWGQSLFDPQLPGSLSHFYAEMSFGQFTLDGAVLPKRYASDHSSEYYGDEGYGVFNHEILTQVDGEVDFSEYDNDGPDGLPNSGDDDGYVDMVFINLNSRPKRFFDADLQDATGIAMLGLSEDFITDDRSAEGEFIRIGEKSGTTQWVWSFAHAVGSMAHEFGHTLGLVDLYDTEFEGPNDDSAGIGNWGLMGRGVLGWHGDVDPDGPVPFSAWSRLWLGWIGELVEVKEDMQGVRLEDVALGGKVVRIQISKYEYFILVNRQPTGNYYDRELPKGGLLIWHIGPGANWWEENKRADLECPDGLYRDRGYPNGVDPDPVFGKDNLDFWAHDAAYRTAHNGNLGDATDVFDGVRYTAFGPETNPASTSNAGNPTGIYVRNIRFEGATAVVDIHPRPVMVVTDEVTFLDENWDQVIESGEEVHVRIRLKNVGGVAVKGLQCRLSTDDPYVVLEDSVASFGELPVGDTATRDTLQFKVAGGFWRQHTATFELEIRDADGNVWVETTEADFVSPQIPLKGLVVLDGGAGSIRGFGNGDGVPNPGETIGLQAVTESPEELSPFNVVFGTEDALVRRMGSSFLIASDAPPGHRISFETQVEGHFAAYRDTLYVEVIGKDETPPQVLHTFSDPSAMEPGTSTTIKVPKRSVVEGGRISRIEARIYALTDLEWVDTVVLQEKSEEFHGVWSYPGTGRFHVRIFAEDEAGNGTESRPLDVLVFYIPSGPPSSGEWTTWTNTGEVTALTFQGNTLWAGTTGGVVRWDLSNGTYVKYTILDGMAGNHVSSLLIDASGNLWAHTREGLCYYDWAGWKRATDGDGVIGERDIRTATPTGGLLLDHSGNVWVGGLNGVSRYDGTTWTTWTGQDIGLPSLWKPTVLLEDHAGNVWAGGSGGVGRFDGEMWTAWTSYAFSFIRTLGVDDLGRVWAGAGNWVSRFDGSEWNHWRTGGDVNRLLSDGSGKLWVGTTKGVSRFDGIGWTDWSIEDDLGGSEGQTSRFDIYRGKCHGVGSLLADAAGHVWAGTYGGGVSRFDGESWQNYGVEKGLKSGIVNSLTLDPSGRVWAGTGFTGDPGGVSRFEDSGWINLDTEGALTGNDIRDLLLDARGDVWIATAGGVNRIHGSEWSYWSAKDGLQPFGSDALQLDGAGNVWMRTANEGVWRFEDSGWTKQSPELDGGQLKTLFPDASGAMVAHLDTGVLMRFEDGQWERWTALESLTKGWVRCPLADPFGNLWMIIQAMGGNAVSALARFDGTHWATWPAKENLPGSDIWALVCDGQGDVWVGLTPESERVSADSTTYVGGGVGRFDGSEWNFWTQEEGLANYIDALLMDSMGNLWVGARNGIRRYDGTTWQSWTLEDEAIGSAQILLQDTYGHIWAGGDNGLSMFDGSGWKRWTMENGLASNNVNDLLVDASGRLWVGTDNGLSMYAPRTSGIAPAHQESPLPRSLVLSPNVPNPFNSTTAIRFEVPGTGRVRLVLYNVLGQRVRTLVDAKHNAGAFAVRWDGKDDAGREVASGVYIGRIEAGGSVRVQKLVLLR